MFLYRNPSDVLRSIKARGWLKSASDVERFSRAWVQSVGWAIDAWRSGDEPNLQVVRYEWLCKNRRRESDAIRDFIEVSKLDLDVFEYRVNTFRGRESDGHSPGMYLKPRNLTGAEIKILLEIAGDLMEKLGYHSEAKKTSCSAA